MTRATQANPYGLSPTMRRNLQRLLDAEARGVGKTVELPWGQADALRDRGLVNSRWTSGGRACCSLTSEGRLVARWRPVDPTRCIVDA